MSTLDAMQNSWLSVPLKEQTSDVADAEKLRSVLQNIAALPTIAKPLRLKDPNQKSNGSRRIKQTRKYQLVTEEFRWIKAWDPIASHWKGVPKILGVDTVLSPLI